MTVEITDQLQIVPPAWSGSAHGRVAITLLRDARGYGVLRLTRPSYALIGAPAAVVVAVSTRQLAVMPAAPDDARSRKVSLPSLHVAIQDIAVLLGIMPGERYICDVALVGGALVADWPETLFARRAMAERRTGTAEATDEVAS